MQVQVLMQIVLMSTITVGTDALDLTLVPGEHGVDVVRAVIAKLEASSGFIGFNPETKAASFMRTMAFVETNDGTQSDYNANEGGIWNVDRTLFSRTQMQGDTRLDSIIRMLNANDTRNYIGPVNWRSILYINLSIPLYSGLAVRMLIQLGGSLPVAPIYPMHWNTYFKSGMSRPSQWNDGLHYLSNNEGMSTMAGFMVICPMYL